jgi:hypothetical protein
VVHQAVLWQERVARPGVPDLACHAQLSNYDLFILMI